MNKVSLCLHRNMAIPYPYKNNKANNPVNHSITLIFLFYYSRTKIIIFICFSIYKIKISYIDTTNNIGDLPIYNRIYLPDNIFIGK